MRMRKPSQPRRRRAELRELGGLEAQGPEPDPAVGVVDRLQEEHGDEEERRDEEEGVDDARPAQRAVVEPQGGHHAGEAQRAPRDLLQEEVVRAPVALLGEGGGGTPHHHEAEAEEGHGHAEEEEVGAELLSHRSPPPPRGASPRP
jgi:hypothetical protein